MPLTPAGRTPEAGAPIEHDPRKPSTAGARASRKKNGCRPPPNTAARKGSDHDAHDHHTARSRTTPTAPAARRQAARQARAVRRAGGGEQSPQRALATPAPCSSPTSGLGADDAAAALEAEDASSATCSARRRLRSAARWPARPTNGCASQRSPSERTAARRGALKCRYARATGAPRAMPRRGGGAHR